MILFRPSHSLDNTVLPPPVNCWKGLESLTILDTTKCLIYPDSSDIYPLIRWLRGQQKLGQPLLHVKLADIDAVCMKDHMVAFCRIYDVLQGCCTLELVNVPYSRYLKLFLVHFPLQ